MRLTLIKQYLHQHIARLALLGTIEDELHVAGCGDEIIGAERFVQLVEILYLYSRAQRCRDQIAAIPASA